MNKIKRSFTWLAVVIAAYGMVPASVADALPTIAMLNLMYNGAKGRSSADEALQETLADVDAKLRDGYASGRISEVRRQLARGISVGFGRGWSDEQDFNASLVARTDQAYVDPRRGTMVRLEQIFPSTLIRTRPVSVSIALHEPAQGRRWGRQTGPKLRDIADLSDVSLDLIEAPIVTELDLRDQADGRYEVRFVVRDGDAEIGSASVGLEVRAGLNGRIDQLRNAADTAPSALSADILYPVDFMRRVNAGLADSRGFNLDEELVAAEQIAEATREGKDPFANRTGAFERHYLLADAGEIMPYNLFVPDHYPSAGDYPLVVALHGLGGDEDSMMSSFYGMVDLAGEKGYLLVSPMGFRSDGFYGMGDSHKARLSEQDVMQVLEMIRERYAIDPDRIYLMGHSMGGFGTWHLASKYPDLWAALGPIAGGGDPRIAPTIAHIPQIVVHGDNDTTVAVDSSRRMVEALRAQDAVVKYIEVPGGGHTDIAPANMRAIFDFFDTHFAKPR
ncbi:MAG: alpha/beta fold hydrolase [Proteobacteria bacterium]|nr:alpha/beta fold hydrolase [Pseudomonadota bacterium]MDA1302192.1 alpha/beta fold hydrolase [Pseudomonadota bacterium]